VRAAAAIAGLLAASALLGASARPGVAPPPAAAGQSASRPSQDLLGILAIEDARAPVPDDVRTLLSLARSGRGDVQRAAIRALGRLERRELVVELVPYLRSGDLAVREEAASAIALAMRGPALATPSAEEQTRTAFEAIALSPVDAGGFRALGRLPNLSPALFNRAEKELLEAIRSALPNAGALRGLESLARLNRKLLPFEDLTLDRLRAIATSRDRTYDADRRRNAMAALTAAAGADTVTVTAAAKDADEEVRRLAMLSLAGAGLAIDNDRRVELLREGVADRSPMVRLEALKGWVRRGVPQNGCSLMLSALADDDPNVVLYGLDALGDQCKDDISVTDRLTAEARTPPETGDWHRESHALVSLAKRAPDRAALALPAFTAHGRWQVRMYAARAAAAADDGATVRRLATDADDNVREAALPAARRLLGAGSDDLFEAALQRTDYQLLRTAARELKGSVPSPALATALGTALERVTAEKKDTSRDPRMALIERLGELGSERDGPWLRPLLRDYDPVVATAAATLLRRWTSEDLTVQPQPLALPPIPTAGELAEDVQAVVTMESGRRFVLEFLTHQAPLTRTRFLRLARANYYDGLTFHRVVPNAFIQGGSPGANEYAGDRLYMRDEVGLEMHTRGTVGISTRGRDTGDAQIFINLVDNPFLDYEYTVFARVCGDGMTVVDRIQEGDRMTRIEVRPSQDCR
jgi:cyclophilin family peptidyl-prolyl cis-trans isomerase/HEAT repeat protein